MSTVVTSQVSLSEATSALQELVKESFPITQSKSVTLEIETCDPLTWLSAQEQGSKVFWATPEGVTEIAGVGVADLVTAEKLSDLRRFQEYLASEAAYDAWYFGGARFDGNVQKADERWRPYRGATFVRPRVVLVRKGDKTTLTCHLMENDTADSLCEQLKGLNFPSMKVADRRLPGVTSRQLTPDHSEWLERVCSIQERIEKGEIDKQVLSRKVDMRLTGNLTSYQLLELMQERAPRCYSFLISSEPGSAFVGCTPELLYSRAGSSVRCEAVAGTRAVGGSEEESEALGRELLSSEKERSEHALVVDHIQEVMEDLSTEVSADSDCSVLRRGDWQHLYKQFEGELQPGVTDLRLLQELSPTPAVAGASVEDVAELEQYDRGWYAGPVGWMSPDAAEFAVGIRSALFNENHLTFFAGAGIVKESDAEEEWKETETKMGTFLRIFE